MQSVITSRSRKQRLKACVLGGPGHPIPRLLGVVDLEPVEICQARTMGAALVEGAAFTPALGMGP